MILHSKRWQTVKKHNLTQSRSAFLADCSVSALYSTHPPFSAMDHDTNTTTLLTSPQPPPNPNLRPTKSTAFKREERRKRKERKRQEELAEALCRWDPLSSNESRPSAQTNSTVSILDTPWPCDPNPPAPDNDSSGWTSFVQPSDTPKRAPLLPLACNKDVQISALKKCRTFFQEEDEEDNEGYADEEGNENDRVLGFFSDLFRTDVGLRRLYEEKRDKGVLVCLVCEKKFHSCISLFHHVSTVSNTKRRRSHRVYGVSMSQVLGLETNPVPVLNFSKGDVSGPEEEFVDGDWEQMEI